MLQHPAESNHPKNTVQLLKLCMPELEIYIGENQQDFFRQLDKQSLNTDTTLVLYPSNNSVELPAPSEFGQAQNTLIFIDASWRKAKKIWLLNPWLHSFASYHINLGVEGSYGIRKTRLKGALSTLEAVSAVLEHQYQINTDPLMTVFSRFKEDWLKFIPRQD